MSSLTESRLTLLRLLAARTEQAIRRRLPARRRSVSYALHIGGQSVHLGISPADGMPKELFINLGKEGSALRPWADSTSRLASFALQSGVPLIAIVSAMIGSRGEPSGDVTGHEIVKRALSIPDCVARILACDFLGREDLAEPEEGAL